MYTISLCIPSCMPYIYYMQVKLLRQIILSGMGDHVARYNATMKKVFANSCVVVGKYIQEI